MSAPLRWLATHRWRWRRIVGADVDHTASGDTAWIGVHRRWRRPMEIELPREDLLDLAEAILAGERCVCHPSELPAWERELLDQEDR